MDNITKMSRRERREQESEKLINELYERKKTPEGSPITKTSKMKRGFYIRLLIYLVITVLLATVVILLGSVIEGDMYTLVILFALGWGLFGSLLFLGYEPHKKLTLQYYNVVKSGERSIAAISEYVGLDYNTVVKHLREMVLNGIFENARVDSESGLIVLVKARSAVEGEDRFVICHGCGAKNKTTSAECEYCGSPLN